MSDNKDYDIRITFPRLSYRWRSKLLPSPGNVLFTLVALCALLWVQSVGALAPTAQTAPSTGTIAYQGRLADADGNPLTETTNMVFRLYAAAEGGAPLWEEQWTASNGVQVSDGLFNVMLGSLTPIPQEVVTGNDPLFLGISVGTDDEMAPRVQLGSVPFAVQALTVPNGSITQEKLSADVQMGIESDILSWISNTTWEFDATGSRGERILIPSDINITVPNDETHKYLVLLGGRFNYRYADRASGQTGFYGDWSLDLLANDQPVGPTAPIIYTGYRYNWQDLGASNYWNQRFDASWIIELGPGSYQLQNRIVGYSDTSMNTGRIANLSMQAIRIQ